MKQINNFNHKATKAGCDECLGLGWLHMPDEDIKILVVACCCEKGRTNAETRAIPMIQQLGEAKKFNQGLFMPQANPAQLVSWWNDILKISEDFWKTHELPKRTKLKNLVEIRPPWWVR